MEILTFDQLPKAVSQFTSRIKTGKMYKEKESSQIRSIMMNRVIIDLRKIRTSDSIQESDPEDTDPRRLKTDNQHSYGSDKQSLRKISAHNKSLNALHHY